LLAEDITKKLSSQKIDVSLPGRGLSKGKIHPLIRSLKRIENIFNSMGFVIADGPEIESVWYNFSALINPKSFYLMKHW
jgi:phenylalanyl-tRNA synthetase alpha chain